MSYGMATAFARSPDRVSALFPRYRNRADQKRQTERRRDGQRRAMMERFSHNSRRTTSTRLELRHERGLRTLLRRKDSDIGSMSTHLAAPCADRPDADHATTQVCELGVRTSPSCQRVVDDRHDRKGGY